jgi:protein-S-isoprenylcysteine O-methyltransferase Ste14
MTLPVAAALLRALWFVAEKVHAARHKVKPLDDRDGWSLKILMAANLTVPAGVLVGFTELGRISVGGDYAGVLGLSMMLAGLFIRWAAIRTLGRYFTRVVTMLEGHRIVRVGLYRHLRHPSYTGYLLGELGLGVALWNWLSIVIIFAPVLAAMLYRIRVEERALAENFGDEYVGYARGTKRLIPKVF